MSVETLRVRQGLGTAVIADAIAGLAGAALAWTLAGPVPAMAVMGAALGGAVILGGLQMRQVARYQRIVSNGARSHAEARGALALAEARMADTRIQAEEALKKHLHAAADPLRDSFQDMLSGLSGRSNTVQMAMEELHAVGSEIGGRAGHLAGQSEKASSAVSSVAGAAEQLSSSAREIADQVHAAARQAESGSEAARSAKDQVEQLQDLVRNIGSIGTTISDLADQTNLLALNATIEAARAGEAGRGFAVVADEVKKLANQTSAETAQITETVNAIQQATDNAAAQFQKVLDDIDGVTNATSSVAGAIEQQTTAISEVSDSIDHASRLSQELTQGLKDIGDQQQEMDSTAEGAVRAAMAVAETAEKLRQDVAQYIHMLDDGISQEDFLKASGDSVELWETPSQETPSQEALSQEALSQEMVRPIDQPGAHKGGAANGNKPTGSYRVAAE